MHTVHLLTKGLATKQMSEKKGSKNQITPGFACNTESLRFFSSESQCSLSVSENKVPRIVVFIIVIIRLPGWQVFTLRSELISFSSILSLRKAIFWTLRWVKLQDIQFKHQNHNTLLLINNFTSHNISYTPSYMHLEPNVTAYVQPLNARIIQYVKAH